MVCIGIDVRTAEEKGRITFETNPSGATVSILGIGEYTTPFTLELVAGTYRYTISLEGYYPIADEISIGIGDEVVISETLNPIETTETGFVEFTSVPSNALIIVDDKEVGYTPMTVELPIGTHHYVIKLKGFQDVYGDVEVTLNETTPISVELERAKGFPIIWLLMFVIGAVIMSKR